MFLYFRMEAELTCPDYCWQANDESPFMRSQKLEMGGETGLDRRAQRLQYAS